MLTALGGLAQAPAEALRWRDRSSKTLARTYNVSAATISRLAAS
jgi:DNA-binding MurR/RpiR family transcriptional regulator